MVVFSFIVSSCCMGSAACVPPRGAQAAASGLPAFLLAWAAHWPLCGCWLKQFLRPVRPIVVTADRGQGASQLVSLLVPANPFADLSRNCVPAIVAFCVFYGIAIQRIENRQGILSGLEVVKQASVTIWKWVVRMARLVFSLCSLTSRGRSDWKLSETFVCRRSFQSRLRRHVRYKQVTAVRFSRMGRDRGNADATL
jgi:proton glutamate symport protein